MSAAELIAAPIPPTPRVVQFKRVSEAEYFALDLAAETRLEYLDGEVIAMAGASPNHNDITGNVFAWLHGRLRTAACRPRMADQRVHVPARRGYVYPDVVVGCGKLEYKSGTNPSALLNPVLIVEVLSPSTATYDLTRKFQAYQSIPGLRHYLLLETQQVNAFFYTREPGSRTWMLRTYDQLGDTLPVFALGVELPLAVVYDAVVFGEGEETDLPASPVAG